MPGVPLESDHEVVAARERVDVAVRVCENEREFAPAQYGNLCDLLQEANLPLAEGDLVLRVGGILLGLCWTL